jgi:hypothetical protein
VKTPEIPGKLIIDRLRQKALLNVTCTHASIQPPYGAGWKVPDVMKYYARLFTGIK